MRQNLQVRQRTSWTMRFISNVKDVPVTEMMHANCNSVEHCVRDVDISKANPFSYMIDTEIITERDMRVDNLGIWNSGKHRASHRTIKIPSFEDEDGCENEDRDELELHKVYSVHPTALPAGSIRKCVWFLKKSGLVFGNALISYSIASNCTFPSMAHGNTKKMNSEVPASQTMKMPFYQRTLPSVLQEIGNRVEGESVQRIMGGMVVERGACKEQYLPRNCRQVYNVKKKKAEASVASKKSYIEEIFSLLNTNNSFVRNATFFGGCFSIFCASDSMVESFKLSCVRTRAELESIKTRLKPNENAQYYDLVNHFTSPEIVEVIKEHCPSPVYVDMTYNVCELYVTVISFRHHAVRQKLSDVGVLCTAAVIFSNKRSKHLYEFIANTLYQLLECNPELRIMSVLTDSEEALNSLFGYPIFSDPCVHLFCELHLRQNTKKLLEKLDKKMQNIIIDDIYGTEYLLDGVYTRKFGLVDSVSVQNFVANVDAHRKKWDDICTGFTDKFLHTQGDRILRGYILPQRVYGGMGSGRATTNSAENANRWLKESLKADNSKNILEVITNLEKICLAKFALLSQSVYASASDFRLANGYEKHCLERGRWLTLNAKERVARLKKIGICVNESSSATSDDLFLPPRLNAFYTSRDRYTLFETASEINRLNQIRKLEDDVYIIDRVKDILRLERKGDGCSYNCSCDEKKKRPLCKHMLALAMKFNECEKLLQSLEDKQTKSSATETYVQNISAVQGKKPGRRGSSKTAVRYNRHVSNVLPSEKNGPFRSNLPTEEELEEITAQSQRTFTEPFHNNFPFELTCVENMVGRSKIRSCASCSISFSTEAPSPENLIFRHMERYFIPNENKYSLRETQHRYLHARLKCIKSRYPYFTTEFIEYDDIELDAAHLQHLKDQFGITASDAPE